MSGQLLFSVNEEILQGNFAYKGSLEGVGKKKRVGVYIFPLLDASITEFDHLEPVLHLPESWYERKCENADPDRRTQVSKDRQRRMQVGGSGTPFSFFHQAEVLPKPIIAHRIKSEPVQ